MYVTNDLYLFPGVGRWCSSFFDIVVVVDTEFAFFVMDMDVFAYMNECDMCQ